MFSEGGQVRLLNEDSRSSLISQGRRGEREKGSGKSRYEMRVNSKVSSVVREFNDLDTESLFRYDILNINVPVRGETDNYMVRIKVSGFLEELRGQIMRNNDILDLRAISRALSNILNSKDVYVSCSCLHPSTKIKLSDGTSPTVEELYNRFSNGEDLTCVSCTNDGELVSEKILRVWITRLAYEFIEVTLDNEQVIITTPDHLYMLNNGIYVPADILELGDVLMPYNHKVVSISHVAFSDPIEVYDIKVENIPNFLVDAGVILHNCPDWKYRMGYWSTMKNINSGVPERRPSKITNPRNNKGPGCKHVMLVLSNISWAIKLASVINNYIIYMQRNRKRQYADVIYPAIYGKAYEEPVQLDIDSEDTIANDKETIDIANQQGRTRGQFTTGNPYRFQSNNNVDRNQISIEDTETTNN